jgi:ABC-type lipoprotein export system ATPase subunit
MKVTLSNVKGVTSLVFEVPSPGVWIISGLNGSGKTSLFASLYRLENPNAFQRYFRAGSETSRVDRYTQAEVKYELNGEAVTYRYGGQRWRASPRRNANLLSASAYPAVHYIEANAERVEPYPNEIETRRVKSCADPLREFMAEALGDDKWKTLSFVNTARGKGALRAHLIPYSEAGRNFYYSEKSFSLGELCVLKVAMRMLAAQNGSLVLIDEVEMALHPQAQIRLFRKIQQIAQAKGLTVLFSTHSSTLIKNCDRSRLVYLRQGASGIDVQYAPYPAQVLGEIAFDEELSTDFIFFVEDSEAKLLLEQMVIKYMAVSAVTPSRQPKYKVVPVGGYPEVLALLASTSRLFPSYVKRYALLDADVKPLINSAVRNGQQPLAGRYAAVSKSVSYLPWTPELGAVDYIESVVCSNANSHHEFVARFPGVALNVQQIVKSPGYLQHTKVNPRDRAKDRLRHLVSEMSAISGVDETHVRRIVYGQLVENLHVTVPATLPQLLGPIFNAR